ncbi:MAG: DEAD/DEAH box helicase [Patescibacteria group bacterium]|nr:DEAD/DEAH box helicase [Patescibacteria group bacterium]
MRTLFKHQKEGVAFLKKKKRAILADQMGLGKTAQAIIAAGENSKKGTLIICPASLKLNWEREIRMIYPEDEIVVYDSVDVSNMKYAAIASVEKAPWTIINYDLLEKHSEWIVKEFKRDNLGTLILDEAHYIKNRKSIRAKESLAIAEHAEHVYCLTGTPIMNRPIEMFTLLKAIGHPLGKYITHFTKRYCGGQMKTLVRDKHASRSFFVMPERAYPFRMQRDRYQVITFMDENGATRIPELKEIVKEVMLRRTKQEVLDLPEKIVSTVECTLGPEWQTRYDNAWDRYLDWLTAHPEGKNINNIVSAQQLVELMKLKQVCSQAKVLEVTEAIENARDQGEKVIVFSQFTETIERLKASLHAKNIRAVTLTGSDSTEDRQRAVDAFQKVDDISVFIGNIQAAGVGITLTAASIVIFIDMDWSPAVNEQAEDRAHRIGQQGTVNVYYYIVKGTIEEDIVQALLDKQGTIGNLMGGDGVQKALFELLRKCADTQK